MDQFRSVRFGPENPGEPAAQRGLFLPAALILCDDLAFAPLQCVIELRHDADVAGDELARSQRLLGRGRQMHQYQFDAAVKGRPLDLGKTVSRRGIDSSHKLEIEYQETAF